MQWSIERRSAPVGNVMGPVRHEYFAMIDAHGRVVATLHFGPEDGDDGRTILGYNA